MKKFLYAGALFLLFVPAFVFSVTTHVTADTNSDETYQNYTLSGAGFRMYLNDIKDERPDLYKALDPMVSDLQSREFTGTTVSVVGYVGGIGLYGLGFYTFYTGMNSAMNSSGSSQPTTSPFTWFLIDIGAGLVVNIAGVLIGSAIYPSRDDYNAFINKHNRLDPDHPLKMEKITIQLGFFPAPDGGNFGLACRF
jgi:hypothetical protein